MGIISINKGKSTLLKCPKPPIYLTDDAKKHYVLMGNILAKNDKLKEIYLNALEIYAESMAQWQFAVSQIKLKNKEKFGDGYIQVFKTGAKNVSVELTLKNDAQDSLLKCFKIFGLDPKSEKELNSNNTAPGQLSCFEEMQKLKTGR